MLVDLAPVLAENQDVAEMDHGRADAPHRGRVALDAVSYTHLTLPTKA